MLILIGLWCAYIYMRLSYLIIFTFYHCLCVYDVYMYMVAVVS